MCTEDADPEEECCDEDEEYDDADRLAAPVPKVALNSTVGACVFAI